MPEVIEFKTLTLGDLGAEPTAQRRTVAIDLRDDWASALQAAGFDPQAPSAWSAEGWWSICRTTLRMRCSTTSPR